MYSFEHKRASFEQKRVRFEPEIVLPYHQTPPSVSLQMYFRIIKQLFRVIGFVVSLQAF
jgi:hypothetical protein